MIDEMKQPPLPNNLMNNSSPYGELQAQPQEILKDKRQESGMVGRDVGFEQALADWLIKRRSWFGVPPLGGVAQEPPKGATPSLLSISIS